MQAMTLRHQQHVDMLMEQQQSLLVSIEVARVEVAKVHASELTRVKQERVEIEQYLDSFITQAQRQQHTDSMNLARVTRHNEQLQVVNYKIK